MSAKTAVRSADGASDPRDPWRKAKIETLCELSRLPGGFVVSFRGPGNDPRGLVYMKTGKFLNGKESDVAFRAIVVARADTPRSLFTFTLVYCERDDAVPDSFFVDAFLEKLGEVLDEDGGVVFRARLECAARGGDHLPSFMGFLGPDMEDDLGACSWQAIWGQLLVLAQEGRFVLRDANVRVRDKVRADLLSLAHHGLLPAPSA